MDDLRGLPKAVRKLLKSGAAKLVQVGTSRGTVMVCMSIYAKPNPKTMMDLHRFLAEFQGTGTGLELAVKFTSASIAGVARNRAIAETLNVKDVVGMFFIDDDMHWPHGEVQTGAGDKGVGFNVLDRLIGRDKDIIGALCTTRSLSPLSLNIAMEGPNGQPVKHEDEEALAHPHNGDPFRTDFLGFGMVYIQRRALLRMLDYLGGQPWFFNSESLWLHHPGAEDVLRRGLMGGDIEELKREIDRLFRQSFHLFEDYAFCRKARAAGCEIWVDPSFMVEHMGDYGYSRMDFLATERERKREEAERQVGR